MPIDLPRQASRFGSTDSCESLNDEAITGFGLVRSEDVYFCRKDA
jgi:hypothetical protein